MLITVTNASGRIINTDDASYKFQIGTGSPADLNATSPGHRVDPLPYPFGHIGEMAIAGTKQLAVHPRDYNHKPIPSYPMLPSEEWNQMVQAGVVSLAIAAQTGKRDVEELLIASI